MNHDPAPPPVNVAVGVIRDAAGRVLINQRQPGKRFTSRWEFPGGKIDPGESVAEALTRELEEELGIVVLRQRPLINLSHDYDKLSVRLHVQEVLEHEGDLRGREGQALRWVAPGELQCIDLLAANAPIVRAATLPRLCLITGLTRFGVQRTLQRLRAHVESARVLLIVREKTLPPEKLAAFINEARTICRANGSLLFLHADSRFHDESKLDGVHYPANALDQIQPDAAAGASCHSSQELRLAAERGAHCALLSAVKPTASHPHAAPLGWPGFQTLCEAATLPVYALGGMQWDDLDTAIDHGAQGIAMLSAAWR